MLATGRDLHVDAYLSGIMIGRRPEGFIADQVVPILSVSKQSNFYYKRNWKENFIYEANLTARAPGTKAKQVFWTVSSDTYFAKNYALGTYWTKEDAANSDDPIALNTEAAELVTDRLLIDFEFRVATLANAASSVNSTVSVATPWSNTTGSKPFDDLANEIEAFRVRTGKRPNRMIVPEQIATYLRRSDQIRDLLFGDKGGLATDQQIAALLKVDQILVPEVLVNTATIGATVAGSGTLSSLWPNKVILAYSSPLPGRKVDTWMQGFRWTDPQLGTPWAVRKLPYKDEEGRQDIDAQYYQDEKIISQDLGSALNSLIP